MTQIQSILIHIWYRDNNMLNCKNNNIAPILNLISIIHDQQYIHQILPFFKMYTQLRIIKNLNIHNFTLYIVYQLLYYNNYVHNNNIRFDYFFPRLKHGY